MLLSLWMCFFSESEPTCRTNVISRNVTDATNPIEILCHVRYNGSCITPVFTCDPHLPSATHSTHHNSSGHVWYRHVIAASDIDDFAVLNCSMTFTVNDSCTVMSPTIPVKPDKPVYKFVLGSPAIHVVNASGKFAAYRADVGQLKLTTVIVT